ncbi:MAG: baseplate J/gp47 family protein [Elusimicrobia bacterium]|nr:baseplate J/gp47 family protein [Elusimicrobiota bacterium]
MTLDQRVALNGISRKVGTYTVAYVIITSDRAQTLPGLDQTALPAYKVSDEAGNQFQLVASHTFSAAGSASLAFRAVNIGQVLTTPNTITNQITTTLGVTAVNNPDTSGDVPGTDEETDAQLKARRGKSFSLAATGPADAIRAAILDMDDVSDAAVIENDTGDPVNGVPAHSIWCIVTGGTEADIAQAIYSKKAPGCGMKGSVTHDITRPQGNTFTAQWDVSSTQALYIQFAIVPRVAGLTFNNDAIKASLAAAMVYKLLQNPSIGDVVMAMQTIEPNAIVTSVAVSVDGDDWQQVVTPDSADKYFTVAVGDISIS